MTQIATVLIPAWNEAAVIGQTLAALRDPRLRLVVIANACTDETAKIARQTAPEAFVLETARPGKINALNIGYVCALPNRPVVFLDADLDTTPAQIALLIDALEHAHAACGQMKIDTTGCTPLVRAYMRAWAHNPYFAKGKFGGLFAVSALAAKAVFPLPQVTADDEFIRRTLEPLGLAYVPECSFTARAPRDLPTLIRVRRRALRGARAVACVGGPRSGGAATMLRHALPRPHLWADMAVFTAIMVLVRLQLALESGAAATAWERDTTNRLVGHKS
jgi:glycosyltransferase involved in cell wall biosynthesis